MGLADLYDTDGSDNGQSDGVWYWTSLMDGGNMNNGGNTPPFYNALGISFLSGLAETLKSPEATAQLVDSIVEKDEQTGETSIKIPVESKETVSNLLNLIGKLFAK